MTIRTPDPAPTPRDDAQVFPKPSAPKPADGWRPVPDSTDALRKHGYTGPSPKRNG